MGFHLTLWDAIRVLGIAVFIPGLLVWVVALASYFFLRRQDHKKSRPAGVTSMLLVIGLATLFFGFFLGASNAGTGWSLNHGMLSVNTGFGSIEVPAVKARTRWVLPSGAYGLAVRVDGTSTGDFQAGHFRLNNGQSASVFEWGHYPVLAVYGSRNLILLSSPGISELPAALKIEAIQFPHPHVANVPSSDVGLYFSIFVGIIVVALQIAMSRYFAPRLPEKVATQVGLTGTLGGYAPKTLALGLGPSFATLLGVVTIMVSLGTPSSLTLPLSFVVIQSILLFAFWWLFRMNLSAMKSSPSR
ncbi:MAG: hypothetical protein C7B46_08135 [Sulfobacillus benefaciens]|uniref:Uncharacterized protein n=1 Tax=Sulfobacillus benefaciens TaxID=453960 RepID=A0A2T2XH51_9FIRM|nr:MAG: hypothetical protein C7B46_08135 [Sulfobacillus benefaciens]